MLHGLDVASGQLFGFGVDDAIEVALSEGIVMTCWV